MSKTCSDGANCTLDKGHSGPCVEQRPCCNCFDDYAHHAPSEYVWRMQEERAMRKRRDKVDLLEVWREEVLERKRENAARYKRWS